MDDDHALAALRAATSAMLATVRAADPQRPVPACPGWTVTDLVDHLGRVHLWAAHSAREGAPPDPYPRRDREQPLADWYAACADTIVSTLSELPPDHPSWSFSADPAHRTRGSGGAASSTRPRSTTSTRSRRLVCCRRPAPWARSPA